MCAGLQSGGQGSDPVIITACAKVCQSQLWASHARSTHSMATTSTLTSQHVTHMCVRPHDDDAYSTKRTHIDKQPCRQARVHTYIHIHLHTQPRTRTPLLLRRHSHDISTRLTLFTHLEHNQYMHICHIQHVYAHAACAPPSRFPRSLHPHHSFFHKKSGFVRNSRVLPAPSSHGTSNPQKENHH